MKVHIIHSGNFKLDGGAMFGVVPKSIWNKLNPSDDNNMCNWAMRCLLIETENQRILIDTGIGNKQSDKFYSHYSLNGDYSLTKSLSEAGFTTDDITDVLLTHLHFDHCGGAILRNDDQSLSLAFPNAKYHLTESHWKHATNPNPREKASFLIENFELVGTSGKLNFVNDGDMLANCIEVKVFDGHTIGMIAPLIHLENGRKILYAADLYPSAAHIPANYVMSYDIQPLITMNERIKMNELAFTEQIIFFYEHDVAVEASLVGKNEKGQFHAVNPGKLANLIG
jgi:glyoxylase-like metal-dependent hydrolase (beta-lactamase superfamily II)